MGEKSTSSQMCQALRDFHTGASTILFVFIIHKNKQYSWSADNGDYKK